MLNLFTADGISRWHAHLNDSTTFAEASASWVGSVLLVESLGDEERAAFVHIERGRCTIARLATAEDAADADFVLRASPGTWQALVLGNTTPTQAAMMGRLHLDKGDFLALLPHAKAAAELLAAAANP